MERITPGSRFGKELQEFPDDSLTTKQIQQFIGIINYVLDFVPRVTSFVHPYN